MRYAIKTVMVVVLNGGSGIGRCRRAGDDDDDEVDGWKEALIKSGDE